MFFFLSHFPIRFEKEKQNFFFIQKGGNANIREEDFFFKWEINGTKRQLLICAARPPSSHKCNKDLVQTIDCQ
jgi:hypothetical protein